MKKETTAMFIGHGECFGVDKEAVREAIKYLIENHGICEFLDGGMGNFDMLCAGAVMDLKKQYPHIRCYHVIPYLTKNLTESPLFDEIIFPEELENCHPKGAITKRNNYMVKNSSAAVCYVTHGWGGAAQTYKKAQKAGLHLINLEK